MYLDKEFRIAIWLIVGLVVLLLLLLCAYFYFSRKDAEEWRAFKTEHKCKVVGKISGNTVTTVMPIFGGGVGVGISSIPRKTGWLCDDGITYWR